MKIAYIINIFPKLSESFILSEIAELLKNGHSIQIFSIKRPLEEVEHEEIQKYHILKNTHYFRFKYIFKKNPANILKYLLYGVIQDLCDFRLSKQPVSKRKRDQILPLNQKIMPKISRIRRLRIAFKNKLIFHLKMAYFATVMEERGVELIHIHFATSGSIGRRLSKMLRLPYTVTTHAFDIYQNQDADELRKVMNDAKSVITISNYNKNYLGGELDIDNRIDVIRCGINLGKFNLQRKIKTNGKIRMLTVARFVEKKGIEYLIKAMPLVIKEVPGCELIFIGSGPLNDNLHQLVCNLDVEKHAQFKGDVSDSELMRCYRAADIFILPCIIAKNGDRDGIPVSLMEAMAIGLPVISTSVSGISELVEDDVSGILVPPKDEAAIANAIIRLCKQDELRVKMGLAGRKTIEAEFNVERGVERLSKLFQDVIIDANKRQTTRVKIRFKRYN